VTRLFVDRERPCGSAIQRAADVIRAGGVVALPTDTLYGLAADPFNPDAVARVFAIKGRGADRALALIAADLDQVVDTLGRLPGRAHALAKQFWPGPLTLLVAAPSKLAPAVTADTGRVGVRVPGHEIARALCRAAGRPLTATSANVSGAPPTADPDDVAAALGALVDVLLDGGPSPGGDPSTIVDATGPTLRLVRPGAIAWDEVLACAPRG